MCFYVPHILTEDYGEANRSQARGNSQSIILFKSRKRRFENIINPMFRRPYLDDLIDTPRELSGSSISNNVENARWPTSR